MAGVSFAISENSRKRRRGQVAPAQSAESLSLSGSGFVDYEDDPSDSDGSASGDAARGSTVIDAIQLDQPGSQPVRTHGRSGDENEHRSWSPAASGLRLDEDSSKHAKKGRSQIARLIERRRIEHDAFQLDEEAAFRQDMKQCAESCRPEDYAKLPVESFGSSLLKAMGWDGNADTSDKIVRALKPRPPLLGLGALARSQVEKGTQKRQKLQPDEAEKHRIRDPSIRARPFREEATNEGLEDDSSSPSRGQSREIATQDTLVRLNGDKNVAEHPTGPRGRENDVRSRSGRHGRPSEHAKEQTERSLQELGHDRLESRARARQRR